MAKNLLERNTQIAKSKEFLKNLSAPEALNAIVKLLKESNQDWDWVGIYVLNGENLELGPYAGEATEHTSIKVGNGVCGEAVAKDKNLVIEDVTSLDNYIACSPKTRSEIVVLIKDGEKTLGQFDLDSDRINAFNDQDEAFLEDLSQLVTPALKKLSQG